MKGNSTRSRSKSSARPKKPYSDFPLYAHPNGYWAKKVRGRIMSFGRWGRMVQGKVTAFPQPEFDAAWRDALANFKAREGDAEAGRIKGTVVPPQSPGKKDDDKLTIKELCNRFLTSKQRKLDSGELTRRSLQELEGTAKRLAADLGKMRLVENLTAADFEKLRADIAKRCGPVRLGNEITRIKSIFKYAADNQLIVRPVNFGSEFKKPDKAVMRRHKSKRDKRLFTRGELLLLLDALDGKEVANVKPNAKTGEFDKVTLTASPILKAMILLGVNAGAGNTDVSNLSFDHLDLSGGWLKYARGKTGIDRRVPLWEETVKALNDAIAARPVPDDKKADKDIVLLNPKGQRYIRVWEKSRTDGVTGSFGKLLRSLGINGRQGLGFYALRHTFATIALQTGDRDAVKALMGHAEGDVLSLYDETGPRDERLEAVVAHVRTWLFG